MITLKRLFYISTVASLVLLSVWGCDSQILDKQPLDSISEANVWQDPSLTEAYLNDLYGRMSHGFFDIMFAGLTDDAHHIHGFGTSKFTQSQLNPTSFSGGDVIFTEFRDRGILWEDVYRSIRSVNVFLDNIGEAAIEDQALRDRLTGEAHFLRAYFYYLLFRQYGAVPVIETVFELDDGDAMLVPRNTLAETVNFIVQEADAAASLLPLQYSGGDLGRATRGAALALKSRVLLFAASDLYHKPSWAGGYSNPEYISYSGANRQQMWRDAKNAARAVMDLGIYSLYEANADPVQNYREAFLVENSEMIMNDYYSTSQTYAWHEADPGLFNGPNGYHTWAGNAPTQQLIDEFDMEDGSEYQWQDFLDGAPGYGTTPYENRDPRFYANILYDGAKWRQRPADVVEQDPEGRIQTYITYSVVDDVGNVLSTRPGLDTRDGPVEDWNGTTTGYYLKKFIDESVNHQFNAQEIPWPYFRYNEVLLNYAEASIELSEDGDARSVLNQIRQRAGMPTFDATVTGNELEQEYRDERRIELMYQEIRYFDIRRWMIAPTVMGEPAMGVTLRAERNENDPYTNYVYTEISLKEVEQRPWNDKMYLFPLPSTEMDRNPELVQNPLYAN